MTPKSMDIGVDVLTLIANGVRLFLDKFFIYIVLFLYLIFMKCEICRKKIELLFLKKPNGTCIKDEKGKKHWVCFECQAIFKNDKAKILDAIFKR